MERRSLRDQDAIDPILDRLTESSLIDSDDRSATRERLDRHHTKILMLWDENRRNRSAYIAREELIVFETHWMDIWAISCEREDRILVWIPVSVYQDEMEITSLCECLYDPIDTLEV